MVTRACEGKVEKARKEVLEIIRELPNSTTRDIATLMQDTPFGTVSSVVCELKDRGVIIVGGTRSVTSKDNIARPQSTYILADENATLSPKPVIRKRPTNTGYKARIKALETKVAELSKWKQSALEQFPQLGISPIILKARELVAAELRERKYEQQAQEVLAGNKDNSVSMTIAVKALEKLQ